MSRSTRILALVSAAAMLSLAISPARAELQCAPAGTKASLPETDPFFASEVSTWAKAISSRYLEGQGKCSDFAVAGYEGFPTKRCSYASVDAGKGHFKPLQATVVILNPSARQLAAWSVNACRANGAKPAAMQKCLNKLRSHIVVSNGAQFPVVGSVVESYCNSSTKYGSCLSLKGDSRWRRPRNTWFRDGISVDYTAAQEIAWDDRSYSVEAFTRLFDVEKSDSNLDNVYRFARIAGATRDQWSAWRKHVGEPVMPNSNTGSTEGKGWRVVSATVQKAACKGASNELFDAVVYSNQEWTK